MKVRGVTWDQAVPIQFDKCFSTIPDGQSEMNGWRLELWKYLMMWKDTTPRDRPAEKEMAFFFFYESCSFDSKQIGRGRSWVKIKLQIQPLPSHRRLPSTQGFPQFVIRWENKARGLANLQWRLSPWHAFWNDWKPKIKRQPWQHCHFMTIFTHLGQWSKDGNVIGKADQVGVSWGSFLRTVAWDMNYMDNFFCL